MDDTIQQDTSSANNVNKKKRDNLRTRHVKVKGFQKNMGKHGLFSITALELSLMPCCK